MFRAAVLLVLPTLLLVSPARAADQTLLGEKLLVKDPKPGDASKRQIVAVAKEKNSPNTLVGDPTDIGGSLTIIVNGANPTSQTFPLPQGPDHLGNPYWRGLAGLGFKYKDGRGVQGPVQQLQLRRTPTGAITVKTKVLGKNGFFGVVPANPGTDASLVIELHGGDRYCIQFGADASIRNKADKIFLAKGPTLEGCPPPTSTTSTSTSTTTSTSTSTTTTLPPCEDGEQNGDETDVDCGGSCPPCEDGATCEDNQDCQSSACAALLCVPLP